MNEDRLDLLYGCLGILFMAGAAIWIVYKAIRDFGWEGPITKLALLINAEFLILVIALHHTPWTLMRLSDSSVEFTMARMVEALLFYLVCTYLLISTQSLRWLMKPRVKWCLYATAASWIVSIYAAAKGWL